MDPCIYFEDTQDLVNNQSSKHIQVCSLRKDCQSILQYICMIQHHFFERILHLVHTVKVDKDQLAHVEQCLEHIERKHFH